MSALSGDVIDLAGGFGFNGPFGVELSDDGGFCMRDGSTEIAAVLSASKYLTPRAVQVNCNAAEALSGIWILPF